MALYENLKDALRETLDANGVLSQLRARTRAEVFRVLEHEEQIRPTVSKENLLINELIREYFEFNHYQYALSVFLSESNQPQPPANRDHLLQELGFSRDPTAKRIPLLYSLAFERNNSNSPKTHPPQIPLSAQPAALATANPSDEFEQHESQRDEILIDVQRKSSYSLHEVHVETGESNDLHFHDEKRAIDLSENNSRKDELSEQEERPYQGTVNVEQNEYIDHQVMSCESVDQTFTSEAGEGDESSEEDPSRGKESHKEISHQREGDGSDLVRPGTQNKTDRSASSGSNNSISVHIEEDTQEPDAYSDDFEATSEMEKTSSHSKTSLSAADGWRGI